MEVSDRLKPWERCILWTLAVVLVLFGALTVRRSAFLSRRMGDIGVFFRAGWAAREGGEQIYTITCDNDLHFHYPPLCACLFIPFADPPHGVDSWSSIPFPVSVAIWYVINLACLGIGLHLLASALESAAGVATPTWSRRWWSLRSVPLLVCVLGTGSTLMQGQITPLVFVLISAAFAAAIRGGQLSSGLWLAAAISVKIFPAFLGIIPLWQRDRRCLAGIALGTTLGFAILPVAVFGVDRTVDSYRQMLQAVISPALGVGEDQSRANELHNTTATDSQALVSAFNSIMHPDRGTRPPKAEPLARALHWGVGGLMTLVTLWSFRRSRQPLPAAMQAQQALLFRGTLVLVMMLICPVCHVHYFLLAIPAVMGLVAVGRGDSVHPGKGFSLIFMIHFLSVGLAQLPNLAIFKDRCLPTYGLLLLWMFACETGRRMRTRAVENPQQLVPADLRSAA